MHGGPRFSEPALVDDGVLTELREIIRFAPLHMPAAIAGIEAVGARWDIPQVACFDTAFHHRMPDLAQRLPLPDALWDAGVRRYGFHGLSYEYVVGAVGAAELGRAVIAHLGNGASMVAVRDGQSVDTTMGFTPAGGLVMSTRSGDLDPGVPVYLLREQGYDADRLEQLVDREAGLVALSGGTADMQTTPRAPGTGPARRRWRSTRSATRPASTSAHWPPCSAGSTRSCSPAASARRRPRSAAAPATDSSTWASSSTTRPTQGTRP